MIRGSCTMDTTDYTKPAETKKLLETTAMQSIKDAIKVKDKTKLIDLLTDIKTSVQKGNFQFKEVQ